MYQTCMIVGASFFRHDCQLVTTVKCMANSQMQLLQTWLMVGVDVLYMDAGKMKL